jgi:hypothetical protein
LKLGASENFYTVFRAAKNSGLIAVAIHVASIWTASPEIPTNNNTKDGINCFVMTFFHKDCAEFGNCKIKSIDVIVSRTIALDHIFQHPEKSRFPPRS